jgi:hypothetical protein
MMARRRGETIDIVIDPSSPPKEQVLDSAGHCLPRDTPPIAIAIVLRGDMEQLIHIDKLSEHRQDRLDARTGKRLRIPIVRDRSVQFDVITSSDSY